MDTKIKKEGIPSFFYFFTTRIDISYSRYNGTATSIIENGSPDGVMTAESTIKPTTA